MFIIFKYSFNNNKQTLPASVDRYRVATGGGGGREGGQQTAHTYTYTRECMNRKLMMPGGQLIDLNDTPTPT